MYAWTHTVPNSRRRRDENVESRRIVGVSLCGRLLKSPDSHDLGLTFDVYGS